MFEIAPIIGHRGLAAFAPENTLAGIGRAQQAGLSWVEVDVRLSSDQIAVLSHDATLRRCGGINLRIARQSAARLGKLPVAAGFAEHHQECVPTLAAACALLQRGNLSLAAELKPMAGAEQATLSAAARAFAAHPPPQIILSSFSATMLQAARLLLPHLPRALNCNRANRQIFSLLKKTAAVNLHCGRNTSRRIIHDVAAAGFGVYVFTVDDAAEAQELLAAGAHGVFSNTGLPDWTAP